MTTPSKRQIMLLRHVGQTHDALLKAGQAHHAAIERAINGGCTDTMLSIELGVSRQAINAYRQRWLTGKPRRRMSDPGQPMLTD